MNKGFIATLCAAFLFFGLAIGFLLAPIKKGVSMFNNSGNTYSIPPEDGCWEDENQEDEEALPF